MRLTPFVPAAFAAALLASCAGGPSSVDCTAIDWTALGFDDGSSGAGPGMFDQRTDACANPVDSAYFAAYSAGREEGLKTYCSSSGGFAAGRKGEEYSGACDPESELQFLESHALGLKLFALTEAGEKAVRDYEAAISDLDQHRYLLRVSEKRYSKPSISNEDREQERQDAEFRRREIARIEGKLTEMLSEIEKTRAALEAYRIELLTMGLEL